MTAQDRKSLLAFLENLNKGQRSRTYTGYISHENGNQEYPPIDWVVGEGKRFFYQDKGAFILCNFSKTSPVLFFGEVWQMGNGPFRKQIGGKWAEFTKETFSWTNGPLDLVDLSHWIEVCKPVTLSEFAQVTTRLKSLFLSTLQIGGTKDFINLPGDSIDFPV